MRTPASGPSPDPGTDRPIRIGLPKGHMQEAVFALLAGAGIAVRV